MTLPLFPAPSIAVDVKRCREPGCDAPRMPNRRGTAYHTRCETHQRAYWRKTKAEQLQRAPAKPTGRKRAERKPKAPKQPAPARKPRRGRKPKAQPPPTKLMLIDYERQTLQLLELVVVSQVPLSSLRRGEPHPHTVGFYEHLGYRIVEIRPRQLVATVSEG